MKPTIVALLVLCFVLSLTSYLIGENGSRIWASICAILATLLAVLAIVLYHFGAIIPNSLFGDVDKEEA